MSENEEVAVYYGSVPTGPISTTTRKALCEKALQVSLDSISRRKPRMICNLEPAIDVDHLRAASVKCTLDPDHRVADSFCDANALPLGVAF